MRKAIVLLLLLSILCFQIPTLTAGAEWAPPTQPSANICYLINSETGTVIYQKNAQQKAYPASTATLMTAIVAAEKYKDKLNTVITVQKSDLQAISGTGLRTIHLQAGEQLTVEQLLYGVLLSSGSDASVVLARAVAGNIDNFVKMMNDEAKTLGCKHTHYVNPTGQQSTDQYTTAADTYLIAKYAMSGIKSDILWTVAQSARYVIPASSTCQQHTLINTNQLLSTGSSYYSRYVKGIKTGASSDAGDCLVSYAVKDGVTYYCVIFNATPYDSADNAAFKDAKALYQWALSDFEIVDLVEQGSVQSTVNLQLAWNQTKIQLVADKQFDALVPSNTDTKDIKVVPTSMPGVLRAPIKKGQVITPANVMLGSQKLGTINLVANEAVARSQPLYFVYLVGRFFTSIWFILVSAVLILLLLVFFILSFMRNRRRKIIARRKGRIYKLPR